MLNLYYIYTTTPLLSLFALSHFGLLSLQKIITFSRKIYLYCHYSIHSMLSISPSSLLYSMHLLSLAVLYIIHSCCIIMFLIRVSN